METEELRLWAVLLSAPNDESLSILNELGECHPWLQPVASAMGEVSLGTWQSEHTRLFINGYPTTVCPPFASVQRHGAMGGDIVGDLEMFYRKCGLASEGMPADYLGTMLECGAILLEEHGANGERLLEFAHTYLKPSLDTFSTCLCEETDLPLYRGMGERIREVTDGWG